MKPKYFIQCIGGSLPVHFIHALKGGVPHRLNHPSSTDKDTFPSIRAAHAQLSAAAALKQRYTLVVRKVETQPNPFATTVAKTGETK